MNGRLIAADAPLNTSAGFVEQGVCQTSKIGHRERQWLDREHGIGDRQCAGGAFVDEPGPGQCGRAHAAEQDPAQLGDVEHEVGLVGGAPSLGAVGPAVENQPTRRVAAAGASSTRTQRLSPTRVTAMRRGSRNIHRSGSSRGTTHAVIVATRSTSSR